MKEESRKIVERRIIENVKFVLKDEKEVPYISPKGYSVIDVELLYHAIKHAALSDLNNSRKQGGCHFQTVI